LPAQSAGHITFGCLNNFCKVSLQAMNAWAAILGAVPGSTLLLYAPVGSHRQETIDRFAHAGVQPSRVAFVGNQSFHDYLRSYQKIDVCLDPFPYTGGMTSLDSLWMAVPFVTLAGAQSPVSRGGCSILANVGLTELVAYDRNEYISKVLGLAGDFPRLSELRSTLRRRMQQSPMLDTPGFTRRIESAYHQMWDCRK
jgi:predicted O-linked N-acetylglucosamine transferase (SPINDLY family)